MAKSQRSKTVKRNRTELRKKVFASVEAARLAKVTQHERDVFEASAGATMQTDATGASPSVSPATDVTIKSTGRVYRKKNRKTKLPDYLRMDE